MEWLGLHLGTVVPPPGYQVLYAYHQPALVAVAYLVACAGSFATLDINERIYQAGLRRVRWQWSALCAACLAGTIWAMHFISMLAFQPAHGTHYDLGITLASLGIAAAAGVALVLALARPQLSLRGYLLCASGIGCAIASMHYVGMAAMHAHAQQHYHTGLMAVSVALAIGASDVALLLGRRLREESGPYHRLLKVAASLVVGAGVIAAHFTGMWALQLVAPVDGGARSVASNNSWQLAAAVASITLLLLVCSLIAALSDKKLQQKDRDLQRVNALLAELHAMRASLEHAATHDTLTNLLNRRGFNQALALKLAHCPPERKLALMCLDIDHFKAVNDQHGHDAGDASLQALAAAIGVAARNPGDIAARLGGDEFCVVLELYTQAEALALAERIRRLVAHPIEVAGEVLHLTTSIGVCVSPGQATNAGELLKRADIALYRCKARGRNGVVCYDSQLPSTLQVVGTRCATLPLDEAHPLTYGRSWANTQGETTTAHSEGSAST
ncbi:diguanylate cyclase domain-containing protein [Pseudomonas typographi]|uniref:diguanylate cyclase domain-containing protein n=1 Tax=Pseudomonas typographi TaxID=2715964 RepID=UPI001684B129|nr:diguanylate cyclase [Pseudomonas typographi]MBD1551389.1 diguanylate cyclase [Pseudomonas typographi]